MAGTKTKATRKSVAKPKSRRQPTVEELAMGLGIDAKALDWFTNQAARTGFGTPNVAEGAEYELVRFSYNYFGLITLYRNHWITRRIVDQPVVDMIRCWPKLQTELKPKEITKIDKIIRKTQVKARMGLAMKWAELFGGSGALMVIRGHENILDQPLDLDDVELGSFKGLIPFDRWAGISPSDAVCTDITRPVDFNLPEYYDCAISNNDSFKVHASRILRFTGPEVPTPEYEAQSYWGISAIEPVYEEIKKRDNMSWNILNLTFRANILGMNFPDLAQMLSGVSIDQESAMKFRNRMAEINHLMSNQSLVPLPKDGKIESTQYSFAGLSDVYQQFQLDISGAAQIPVTRLWGRTITGLGQANDADERIYEERINSKQDSDMRPQLEKLYPVICMSELGTLVDDLDFAFPSVRVLDEKEKAELARTVVDACDVAVAGGFISPRTAGKELKQASAMTDIFSNLTDEDIEKLSDEVQAGDIGMDDDMDSPFGPEKQEKKAQTAIAKGTDSDDPAVGEREINGLKLMIETLKGDVRAGKGFRVRMPADYGYIEGVRGADGDSLDCYVGEGVGNGWVYVIDQAQISNSKKFDEHKCMINFQSMTDAVKAYREGHHRSNDVYMDMTPMPLESFKTWIQSGDMRRPCAEQSF